MTEVLALDGPAYHKLLKELAECNAQVVNLQLRRAALVEMINEGTELAVRGDYMQADRVLTDLRKGNSDMSMFPDLDIEELNGCIKSWHKSLEAWREAAAKFNYEKCQIVKRIGLQRVKLIRPFMTAEKERGLSLCREAFGEADSAMREIADAIDSDYKTEITKILSKFRGDAERWLEIFIHFRRSVLSSKWPFEQPVVRSGRNRAGGHRFERGVCERCGCSESAVKHFGYRCKP